MLAMSNGDFFTCGNYSRGIPLVFIYIKKKHSNPPSSILLIAHHCVFSHEHVWKLGMFPKSDLRGALDMDSMFMP